MRSIYHMNRRTSKSFVYKKNERTQDPFKCKHTKGKQPRRRRRRKRAFYLRIEYKMPKLRISRQNEQNKCVCKRIEEKQQQQAKRNQNRNGEIYTQEISLFL